MILGIDEVGRGPWAGPLVVGAVVLGDAHIEGLTDSKKLSKKRRDELAALIHTKASGIGLGWVHAGEIDKVGLSEALRLATRRAVEQIHVPYHEIIIDGTVNFLFETSKGQYVTTMKKADLLIASVSAASIVAKVARDQYMAEQDLVHPGYGFADHVGYGTAKHSAAIKLHGVTAQHRLSIKPLQAYGAPSGGIKAVREDTSKKRGDMGENAAAVFLQREGHEILERNWKTKFCEIDIVSLHNDVLYFTEVKYRKNAQQGDGIAAITPKKLRQMTFAARYYALKHGSTSDLRLAAVSVAGSEFVVQNWVLVD